MDEECELNLNLGCVEARLILTVDEVRGNKNI